MNILQRIIRSLIYRTTNSYWTKAAIRSNRAYSGMGNIYVPELNKIIKKGDHVYLLNKIIEVTDLIERGLKVKINKKSIFTISNLLYNVSNEEEIFILHEIFCKDVYNHNLSANNWNIIDVGVNVGYASIYFAGYDTIHKVFGFEPVQYNVKKAKLNIKLNDNISDKIVLHDYGLSNDDKEVLMKYNENIAGQSKIISNDYLRNGKSKIVAGRVRRASSEIEKIIKKYTYPLVMKMDCEGSEYLIVQDLFKSGLLNKIQLYMIEYHDGKVYELIQIFRHSGYSVIKTSQNNGTGMMYAIRSVDKGSLIEL